MDRYPLTMLRPGSISYALLSSLVAILWIAVVILSLFDGESLSERFDLSGTVEVVVDVAIGASVFLAIMVAASLPRAFLQSLRNPGHRTQIGRRY